MLCLPASAILKTFWSCFDQSVDVFVFIWTKTKARDLIGWAVSRDHLTLSLNLGIFRTGYSTGNLINFAIIYYLHPYDRQYLRTFDVKALCSLLAK